MSKKSKKGKNMKKVKDDRFIVSVKVGPKGQITIPKEARDMFDIKIYVEADADERILRRALRDVEERGRDLHGIIDQYLTTVKPMHYQYVEPTKARADFILNSGMNEVAFSTVCARIRELLA